MKRKSKDGEPLACHPVIMLLFFITVFISTIKFNHPVFLAISFVTAFLGSLRVKRRKPFILYGGILLLIPMYTVWYSSYHHFGVTNLWENSIGNYITLEAIVSGMVRAIVFSSILLWLSYFHTVMESDKIIYLTGRISPRGSLFITLLFRMVPRIKKRAARINLSQSLLGKGAKQGNLFQRLFHCVRIVSILITWTIESFIELSDSMKSRGFTLKKRTAYSLYRFENRDRIIIIVMTMFITLLWMGFMLGKTNIYLNPEIQIPVFQATNVVFYVAYAIFALSPYLLAWIDGRNI